MSQEKNTGLWRLRPKSFNAAMGFQERVTAILAVTVTVTVMDAVLTGGCSIQLSFALLQEPAECPRLPYEEHPVVIPGSEKMAVWFKATGVDYALMQTWILLFQRPEKKHYGEIRR